MENIRLLCVTVGFGFERQKPTVCYLMKPRQKPTGDIYFTIFLPLHTSHAPATVGMTSTLRSHHIK